MDVERPGFGLGAGKAGSGFAANPSSKSSAGEVVDLEIVEARVLAAIPAAEADATGGERRAPPLVDLFAVDGGDERVAVGFNRQMALFMRLGGRQCVVDVDFVEDAPDPVAASVGRSRTSSPSV